MTVSVISGRKPLTAEGAKYAAIYYDHLMTFGKIAKSCATFARFALKKINAGKVLNFNSISLYRPYLKYTS
jgi:hypothetical protein